MSVLHISVDDGFVAGITSRPERLQTIIISGAASPPTLCSASNAVDSHPPGPSLYNSPSGLIPSAIPKIIKTLRIPKRR